MRRTWVKWNLKWQSRATESRRKWTEVIPFSLKIANRGKGARLQAQGEWGGKELKPDWCERASLRILGHTTESESEEVSGNGLLRGDGSWWRERMRWDMCTHTPPHTVYRNTQEKGNIVHKDQQEAMKHTERSYISHSQNNTNTHGCCHSVFCTTLRVQGIRTSKRKLIVKLPLNFTYLLTLLARALIIHWFDSYNILLQQ